MVDIKEHIRKGYIHTRIVIEIIGKPKEHIEQALKEYVEKIDEDKNLIIIKKSFSEAKQIQESELFNIFSEMEILVKGFNSLIEFCFNYMPASIEILDPSKLTVDAHNMTNLFNDFQEKLHKADFLAKTTMQQNQIAMKNLKGMIRNSLVILLKDKGLKITEICTSTGLKEKDMIKYIDEMIKEGKIRKIGEKYFIEF